MPEQAHVGRVRLQVANLERSLAFYQNVVGFRVIERGDVGAGLGAAGGDDVLLELVEKPDVRPVPRRGRLGLYHFAVLLPSRPALGAFIRDLGGTDVQVGMSDHLYSQSIYLYDPDGLGVEVYADQPRDTWTVRDGQYVGIVDPLDVGALVRLAGETTWSGLPAGTTIGHVHLSVGDLARAAAFYHEGLGFDRVGQFPGALFVSAGGYHHHVGLNIWAAGSPAATEDDARLLEWQLVVPTPRDVAAVTSNVALVAAIEEDAGSAIARDPWGIQVRVVKGS